MNYANYDNKVQSGYNSPSQEFDPLFEDLNEVDIDIRRWTRKAREVGCDIQDILLKIDNLKNEMPSLQYDSGKIEANFKVISRNAASEMDDSVVRMLPIYAHVKQKRMIEMVLIYQNRARRYYLFQLIQKCLESQIAKMQNQAEKQFPPKSPKLEKSMRSVAWLKKQLPELNHQCLQAKEYTDLCLAMQRKFEVLMQNINSEIEKLELAVS